MLPPRKKMYIHIGYPKTATTSIQLGLYQNYKELRKYDYLFPQYPGGGKVVHTIAKTIFHNRPITIDHPAVQRFLREVNDTPLNNVIISNEFFTLFFPDLIDDLFKICSGFDVLIVVYLRRQDLYLQSLWAQMAKNGLESLSFEDWVKAYLDNIDNLNKGTPTTTKFNHTLYSPDYLHVINRWADVFGINKIIVRPFERSQVLTNVFADFLQTCGLQNLSWVPIPHTENVTPSFKILEVFREIGKYIDVERYPSIKNFENRLRRDLFTSMQDNAIAKGWNTSKLNRLTFELHSSIMSYFETSNQTLAQTFLGRDELFLEVFEEKPISTFSLSEINGDDIIDLLAPSVAEYMRTLNTSEK